MILLTNEKYYDLLNTAVELLNTISDNMIAVVKIDSNPLDVFIIERGEKKINNENYVMAFLTVIKNLSDLHNEDKLQLRGLLNLISIQLWKNHLSSDHKNHHLNQD